MGKSRIKGLSIQYCCQRPNSSSAKRKLLSDLAMHLKAKVEGRMLSFVGVYQPVLDQLADLDREVARGGGGAQNRARARWME